MDVAKEASTHYDNGARFGVSKSGTAALLRKLADDIEAGRADVLNVRNLQRATGEDFATETLIVRFHTRSTKGERHTPTIIPSNP